MGRIVFLGGLLFAAHAFAAAAADELDEIVVTATLRSIPLESIPGSVAVLNARTLDNSGQQHLEDVLALVPNLNWAGDTSRPRYLQIRGIGELQQYQGAPNPSVAFLIDDIDFSGLASAATLFDVDQVEVLRGPQGTLYGANALAGLIYLKSAEPAPTFGARVDLDAGDYRERSYGAVITGPVAALDSSFRLAIERYGSDGFYHNAYLARSDTDARDELTVRARWRLQPNTAWRIDFTLLRVALNNGYDAWSIDNSRITESDHPSVDRQYSTGFSARASYAASEDTRLLLITTYADSVVNYGYDGEWGNPRLWAPYLYDFSEYQVRHRATRSAEARLAKTRARGLSWLFGAYAAELREGLTDLSTGRYADPEDPSADYSLREEVQSRYRSRNLALYGELDATAGARAHLSLGVRAERRSARYADATSALQMPLAAQQFAPIDELWGGHASLNYALAPGSSVYALLARGYKAGGFNLSAGLPLPERLFAPESDLNVEIGHKGRWLDAHLGLDTSLFYTQRHSEQLLTGTQLIANDPNTFVYYTGNARSGTNYGLESTLEWHLAASLTARASLGLLHTLYRGLAQNGTELPERALPHAPGWQGALSATWQNPRGPYLHLDVTGMGAFYYDLPPNDTRSRPYGLLNVKLGWRGARLETYFWCRNVLDKNYTVRGFYFGDEPPLFADKLYTQLGEPRNFGLHLTYRY